MTLFALWFSVLLFGKMCMAHAGEIPLDRWRQSVTETRILADNDAPRAWAKALQLQASLPKDATPVDQAKFLNLLSRIQAHLSDTAQAISYAQRAFDIAMQHGDKVGQVDESVTTCMQAMEVARHAQNPLALVYAHQCMGIAFSQVGRIEDSAEHYRHMRKQARAAHSKLLEGYALLGMAGTAAMLGSPQHGEAHIRESITLFRAVNTAFSTGHAVYSLADLFRRQGKYAEALQHFNEVLQIYMRHPNKIGRWYTLNARSETYQALGHLPSAMVDAEQAYVLAKESDLPRHISDSAQRVAAVAAALGDHRRAYQLSVEAAELTAKATREKVSERVVELVKHYETEHKHHQIEDLTRRNEQQTAELKQHELEQRLLWTVLSGCALMLAGTGFFLVRLRRSHRTIRNLNAGLEQRVQERTAELRQQARYLRTLIDALPWWVWLKDVSSRYLAVNQAAAASCGLSADDMLGKSDPEIRAPKLAEAFMAGDQEVIVSRRSKTVEEMQQVNGQQLWLEIFKAPVLDEDGTVLGTVGLARDISERKAAEEAREAALAEAQRLARLRSEFLAQMSHELRTPLNGILGYTQILRRDTSLDPHQAAGINVIHQSGEHLLTLINETLDMAKIEAGKLELFASDLSLPRFLRSITELVRIQAEQKNVSFICALAPNLPAVIRADEKRLRQTLLNLLGNAVKFTENGQVQLQVDYTPPSRLRFEVSDTGSGIGADQLETIVHPFEQAGDAQHRLGGTSLGLTISSQFVRLMGGKIQAESRVGEGSRFWFELDLPVIAAAVPAPHKDAVRIVNGYQGPRKTVLVVDDIAENRAVAVDMLGRIGFTMSEAVDGQEALKMAQALKPDLILMDVVLPEMDGMETTRRLRELPGLREVPIIAISASAHGDDEARCLAAGMNAFLPKPVDLDRLLDQVAALLNLEWMYRMESTVPPLASAPVLDDIVPPPSAEMDILDNLARRGDMHGIQQRLAHIVQLNGRYQPFAEQLHRLASQYQSKAVTNFIEQHMKDVPAP